MSLLDNAFTRVLTAYKKANAHVPDSDEFTAALVEGLGGGANVGAIWAEQILDDREKLGRNPERLTPKVFYDQLRAVGERIDNARKNNQPVDASTLTPEEVDQRLLVIAMQKLTEDLEMFRELAREMGFALVPLADVLNVESQTVSE